MSESVVIQRPQRWDNPLDPDLSEEDIERMMALDLFRSMDPDDFPPTASLRDIVRNDTRLIQYQRGDIVIRAGDYGTSAFVVVSGNLRVVLRPGLSDDILGRGTGHKKGIFGAFAQFWSNPSQPEVRDVSRYQDLANTGARRTADEPRVYLKDVPEVLEQGHTVRIGTGEMFGEIAALARASRTTTIFAEDDAEVLEIRRQGIRDVRRRVVSFREHIDRLYRERGLKAHLRETPLFQALPIEVIDTISEKTLFETYGDFDWHTTYNRLIELDSRERLAREPIIVREADYPDGLLLVRSGFARVSREVNNGHQTVSYIGKGAMFGLEEIVHNWREQAEVGLRYSLRSVGYTDILRVPTSLVEEYILPSISEHDLPPPVEPPKMALAPVEAVTTPSGIETSLLENLVEYRLINGTQTMLINLDRCVRCDSCVQACAMGHDNNPRFVRHGRRFDHYMVANACMHCADPVCMLGCPTGAIHRVREGGQVAINDETCIGCATCATNCPYDNIRMVDIRDKSGNFVLDENTNAPIMKATKCDLCFDQPGGPACQRACPHDALVRVNLNDLPSLVNWTNR